MHSSDHQTTIFSRTCSVEWYFLCFAFFVSQKRKFNFVNNPLMIECRDDTRMVVIVLTSTWNPLYVLPSSKMKEKAIWCRPLFNSKGYIQSVLSLIINAIVLSPAEVNHNLLPRQIDKSLISHKAKTTLTETFQRLRPTEHFYLFFQQPWYFSWLTIVNFSKSTSVEWSRARTVAQVVVRILKQITRW